MEHVGDGLRQPAADFARADAPGSALDRLARLYAAFVLHQAGRGVACNSLHPAEQRTARWLLTTRDRVGADHFHLTQELLGAMLGVRRQTVSEAAARMQREGVISYQRGNVRVLDATRLGAAACD